MRSDFLPQIGETIRAERRRRALNQAELAARLGRAPSRVSELERELLTGRRGKDRLTLLVEICDALDLTLVVLDRDQLSSAAAVPLPPSQAPNASPRASVFDEVFVDLEEESPEDSLHG